MLTGFLFHKLWNIVKSCGMNLQIIKCPSNEISTIYQLVISLFVKCPFSNQINLVEFLWNLTGFFVTSSLYTWPHSLLPAG